MRLNRHAEVPGGKSDKEHKSDAQRDAEDFYSPECKSDGDDERVHQDDVRDRRGGGENGFHDGGCGSSASRGKALDALDL